MEYVTINEAVRITGKSATAIRRLVEKLSKEGNPGVIQKEETPQGYKYRISREFLCQHYNIPIETAIPTPETPVIPADTPPDSPADNPRGIPPDSPEDNRIKLYEDMIALLKDQVRTKDEQLQHMFERLRESNVISNNYQQRLLAIQEAKPEPVPMPADEKKKEPAWVAWLLLAILVTMLGLATYFSLPG